MAEPAGHRISVKYLSRAQVEDGAEGAAPRDQVGQPTRWECRTGNQTSRTASRRNRINQHLNNINLHLNKHGIINNHNNKMGLDRHAAHLVEDGRMVKGEGDIEVRFLVR